MVKLLLLLLLLFGVKFPEPDRGRRWWTVTQRSGVVLLESVDEAATTTCELLCRFFAGLIIVKLPSISQEEEEEEECEINTTGMSPAPSAIGDTIEEQRPLSV
jgi:hypothetical protein